MVGGSMNFDAYRARISVPISENHPVGSCLVDDSLFDFVEEQMMKVGSLTHADVQWLDTELSALTLIETKSKDLKILTHLLLCLQHPLELERFTLSLYVLADFICLYWNICYPIPGEAGLPLRNKYLAKIMQRTETVANKLDAAVFEKDQKKELDTAIALLEETLSQNALPLEQLQRIKNKFVVIKTEEKDSSCHKLQMVSTSQSSIKNIQLDKDSHRNNRQSLLKVADVVAEFDDGQALALRLRRFAIWCPIVLAPDSDASGETDLMPVAADRIAEYEDKLKRDANMVLFNRIEQSLLVSPYWFDGHFLSYQLAKKLNKEDWAEAIIEQARLFIDRLPSLLDKRFKGGMPFVSEQTRLWLKGTKSKQNFLATQDSWEHKRSNVLEIAKEKGLPEALIILNERFEEITEPRDQFYWKLLCADVMHSQSLFAMASLQYKTLLNQAKTTTLNDWEPSLISRLKHLIDAD